MGMFTTRLTQEQIKMLMPLDQGKRVLKQQIQESVRRALEEGLDPVYQSLKYGEGEIVNLPIPTDLSSQIAAIAKRDGKHKSSVIRGLVAADLARHGTQAGEEPSTPEFAEHLKSQGWDYRPHQELVYLRILDAFEEGGIGAVEAATGTGKTYAMLLAAVDTLKKKPDARIVIAAPTLVLVRQFHHIYRQMRSRDPSLPPATSIFGRGEFVSRKLLEQALQDEYYKDPENRVREWMEKGAPPPGETKDDAYPLPWTKDGLKAVAPKFPVDDVSLTASVSSDDPGENAYQAQFRTNAPIVFCTHAMLAVNIRFKMNALRRNKESEELRHVQEEIEAILARRKRMDLAEHDREKDRKQLMDLLFRRIELQAEAVMDEGRLPRYNYLLIDEAHLLENAFANLLSQQVSLRKVASNLKKYWGELKRKSGVTQKDLKHANELVDRLSRWLEKNGNGNEMQVPGRSVEQGLIVRMDLEELGLLAEKVRAPSANSDEARPDYRLVQRYYELKASSQELLLASKTNYLWMRGSPVLKYPSVIFGKPDVSYYLQHLWESARGAACLSATLYLPVVSGVSLGYQKECLALPRHRLREYPPIQPEWVKTQVEAVYLPSPKAAADLRPPLARDKLDGPEWAEAEDRWLASVASRLRDIDQDAKGGILVLMTAYRAVERLHWMLAQIPEMSGRLVVANRKVPLDTQRDAFFALTRGGVRPIWLAIGGAWTGVDISAAAYSRATGEYLPPEKDWVLTDLVIPRIPLGTNQSITHKYRMESRPGGQWEVLHALFVLRQGIGRLVRSENLPGKRRIHLLDGRMADPEHKELAARVRRILDGYSLKEWDQQEEGETTD